MALQRAQDQKPLAVGADEAPSEINVVLNWFTEIEARRRREF
jgi:hypothetical protein